MVISFLIRFIVPFTVIWMLYTILFAAFACPEFDDMYEKWISERAEWIHYHINAPIAFILTILSIAILVIGLIIVV